MASKMLIIQDKVNYLILSVKYICYFTLPAFILVLCCTYLQLSSLNCFKGFLHLF